MGFLARALVGAQLVSFFMLYGGFEFSPRTRALVEVVQIIGKSGSNPREWGFEHRICLVVIALEMYLSDNLVKDMREQ